MGKRPFVIDCDTGTDDAIALLAAFGSPEIEVKAVTAVNGNVKEEYTSANNRNMAEYLGWKAEIGRGASLPLYSRGSFTEEGHGENGLGNIRLPEAVHTPFSKDMAPEVIRRLAEDAGGELELLVTGPMTNIAIAVSLFPQLRRQVKHIWFMGGAVRGGNMTTTAEFNLWVDPTAAKLVAASGIPLTMVGLDVTEKAILEKKDSEELRKFGTKASVLAADLLDYMIRRSHSGGEGVLMHDALALAAAVYPQCLVFERGFLDVECAGEYTAGHTVVDFRGRLGRRPNADVAVGLDLELFRRWLVEAVKRS